MKFTLGNLSLECAITSQRTDCETDENTLKHLRAVHIHFKIRTLVEGRTHDFTSQFFFDDALTDKIHAKQPYIQNGVRDRRNDRDGIYRESGGQLILALRPSGAGFTTTFDLGVDLSRSASNRGGRGRGGRGGRGGWGLVGGAGFVWRCGGGGQIWAGGDAAGARETSPRSFAWFATSKWTTTLANNSNRIQTKFISNF